MHPDTGNRRETVGDIRIFASPHPSIALYPDSEESSTIPEIRQTPEQGDGPMVLDVRLREVRDASTELSVDGPIQL
jgi:hypothetical protein